MQVVKNVSGLSDFTITQLFKEAVKEVSFKIKNNESLTRDFSQGISICTAEQVKGFEIHHTLDLITKTVSVKAYKKLSFTPSVEIVYSRSEFLELSK